MNKGCGIAAGALLFLLSLGLGYYFYTESVKDPEVNVSEKPVIGDVVKKTVATGAVKPRQEIMVKPQVSGVVEELYVEAGQSVKKGQQLAKIKLVPSQVNINNAQSSVELARIRYDEARRELTRQKEIYGKKLDVSDAQANFANAQREEQRQAQLLADGVISQQEYDRAKLALDLAKASFDNSEIISVNSLRRFEADVDISRQEYDAAVNNLQLLREGASKKSRQVANVVTSTVDGMILDVPVEEGTSVIERNNFNEGTTIATIADMNSLIFEGQVDESDVGKLKEGMPLVLTVGAIEDEKFDANLEYISPKGTDEDGTVKFEVRAAIKPQKDIFLRAGYSANADIILDKKEKVVTIKERDVIFEDEKTYVEVETGEQQYEKREIKTGLSDGVTIEVKEGLDTLTLVKTQ